MEKWRILCDSNKIKLAVNGVKEEIFFNEKEQKEYKGIKLREGELGEYEYVLISSKYLDEYCKEQETKIKEHEEAYEEGYKKGMEAGKKTYEQSLKKQKEHLKGLKLGAKGREPIPNEKVRLIKKMHLEGHSVRSIAKTIGVGIGTVQKYSK